ncbi:hypothetical protein [Litorimonas haliclonae]|uniref:hypothetical protein n=1 Tax=Litorimonas haliclonae TaxID=2081977 RepID=UPI0039EEF7F7
MLSVFSKFNFISLIALLLVSCGQQNKTLRVEARIDSELLKSIKSNYYLEPYDLLVISSYGGDELAAIEIRKFLSENKIRVAADKYCLSSCAMHILLPLTNSTINNDTLVALHPSAASFDNEHFLTKIEPSFAKKIRKISNSVNNYDNFDARGLYNYSLGAMMPTCTKDANNPVSFNSRYNFWIPNEDVLRKYGVRINGYWPSDFETAQKLVLKYMQPNLAWAYGLSELEFLSDDSVSNYLSRIPKC